MSLLDDENKIDDDLQMVISKKAFKEALDEKAQEITDRFREEMVSVLGRYNDDICRLEKEIIALHERNQYLKYLLDYHVKSYELSIMDNDLKEKICLVQKSINFD